MSKARLLIVIFAVIISGCCPDTKPWWRPCGGLIGTDIGAYGGQEQPRQEYGESDRHYRHRLDEGGWTF